MSLKSRVTIHSQGFSVTPAIREHLHQRFSLALERFEEQILRIDVFMKDLNGTEKRGEDQSVLVKVKLRAQSDVITETTTHDLYLSISLAARRTRRIVGRAVKRHRRIERVDKQQRSFPASELVTTS